MDIGANLAVSATTSGLSVGLGTLFYGDEMLANDLLPTLGF